MSFDIFLGCFRHGAPSGFPREIVDHAFGALVTSQDDQCWYLSDGAEVYIDSLDGGGNEISALSVNRPPGEDEFWAGLLEILQKTTSVLYWPGTGAIVGDEATIAELPPDMLKALGEIKVCRAPHEMTEFIRTH